MTSKNKKQRNRSDSAGLNAVWLYRLVQATPLLA